MSKTKDYYWQELLHDNNTQYQKELLNAEYLETLNNKENE